jgi:hypothetical protein
MLCHGNGFLFYELRLEFLLGIVFDFLDRALVSSVFRVLARKIEILMQPFVRHRQSFLFFFVICEALKKRRKKRNDCLCY